MKPGKSIKKIVGREQYKGKVLKCINIEGGSTKNIATNEHTQLYTVRLKQRIVIGTISWERRRPKCSKNRLQI
jgi:metal-dependent amidase/aminoacylase/carboxypeptidase family protein